MAYLSKVVDDTSDLSEEVLIKQKEYIESYDKIETYVKNGIKENTYVVWVYYETKLLNIDTSAPGSSVLYVEIILCIFVTVARIKRFWNILKS